jgi:NCS1 family nucleobase:cation symporter-1
MAAYFIYWFIQLITCFFRPHQIRWLFTVKAVTMPLACFGLFIWALVRSGGPGSFELTSVQDSSTLLAFTFLGAINACINGEFGPLIASERKSNHATPR